MVFIDEDELETVLVLPEHIGMLAEQANVFEQQITEIGGVEDFQPLLIGGVELAALSVAEDRSFPWRHLSGRQASVLPAVDQPGKHPRRPALVVNVLGLQ